MCLNTDNIDQVPYNKSRTRWKVLMTVSTTHLLESPVVDMFWTIGKTYYAECKERYAYIEDVGFHVMITRDEARELAAHWNEVDSTRRHVVVKIEVSDFVAAGMFCDWRTETWTTCKVVEIAR